MNSKISALVVADSISPAGVRLTTLELLYPRIIHSELKTHRMFSTNSSSSRAVPALKFIEQVEIDPACPSKWGENQPGMVAKESQIPNAHTWWLYSAMLAASQARKGHDKCLHKQIVNRIIEPFQWMRTLVTATEWSNFFDLRDHPDADPTIQELARTMKTAMANSTPIDNSGWHLPYITEDDLHLDIDSRCKVSAARCARISYCNHGAGSDYAIDIKRAKMLQTSGHWSPFEHIAVALNDPILHSGNFIGWHQYRQILQNKAPFYKVSKNYLRFLCTESKNQ